MTKHHCEITCSSQVTKQPSMQGSRFKSSMVADDPKFHTVIRRTYTLRWIDATRNLAQSASSASSILVNTTCPTTSLEWAVGSKLIQFTQILLSPHTHYREPPPMEPPQETSALFQHTVHVRPSWFIKDLRVTGSASTFVPRPLTLSPKFSHTNTRGALFQMVE